MGYRPKNYSLAGRFSIAVSETGLPKLGDPSAAVRPKTGCATAVAGRVDEVDLTVVHQKCRFLVHIGRPLFFPVVPGRRNPHVRAISGEWVSHAGEVVSCISLRSAFSQPDQARYCWLLSIIDVASMAQQLSGNCTRPRSIHEPVTG